MAESYYNFNQNNYSLCYAEQENGMFYYSTSKIYTFTIYYYRYLVNSMYIKYFPFHLIFTSTIQLPGKNGYYQKNIKTNRGVKNVNIFVYA